jgi:hypothetical protein
MSLVKDFESFFFEYDGRSKSLEAFTNSLLDLLHRLADDPVIEVKERQKISTLIATLDTDLEEIQDLNQARDKGKELKEILLKIRTIINDFRHGEIYKRFRQSQQDSQNLTPEAPRSVASPPSREDRVPSPEAKTHVTAHVDESWRAAINIAKEIKPHGSVEEILTVARELRTMASQQGRIEHISRAPQGAPVII